MLTKEEMATFLTDPEVAIAVLSDKMSEMNPEKRQGEIESITKCISNPDLNELHTKAEQLDRD